jgi:hypothetical protein
MIPRNKLYDRIFPIEYINIKPKIVIPSKRYLTQILPVLTSNPKPIIKAVVKLAFRMFFMLKVIPEKNIKLIIPKTAEPKIRFDDIK